MEVAVPHVLPGCYFIDSTGPHLQPWTNQVQDILSIIPGWLRCAGHLPTSKNHKVLMGVPLNHMAREENKGEDLQRTIRTSKGVGAGGQNRLLLLLSNPYQDEGASTSLPKSGWHYDPQFYLFNEL